MAWDDLGDLEHRLKLALHRFDWEAADETCRNIIDRLPGETSLFPAQTARALLPAIRPGINRSRHAFRCRTVPAGAYPRSGDKPGGTVGSTRPDGAHLQAALCRRSWKSEP